jgi:predicted HTH transcriptional regulator
MTKDELEQLLTSDEDYRIERTVSTTQMDKFQEAICLPTFDMMPCREATLDDIDVEAIRKQYMPHAIDPEILVDDHREIKEQLASLRLYSRQYDCPTMAAIILFGREPRYFLPGCYVQFVRFAGKDKGGAILNEREFKGGLFTLLPRLEMFVADAIVTNRPVSVSLFREKTVSNYPNAVLRELLNNACMHRSYQSNTPIRLYQFDDRIEIMNAGGLYGEARPENFPTVNAYRNPVVAEAMKVLKYVNMFNRGISRVQEQLIENGSEKAVFSVDKLTVFEVRIEDANVTDLKRFGAEFLEQARSEQAQREQAQREQAQREQAQREQPRREQPQSEQPRSEQAQREQAQSEQAQREQAQSEHAQREQAQSQTGGKDKKISALVLNLADHEYTFSELLTINKFSNSRRYFIYSHLNPAIKQGYIALRYPNTPRHPNQKYYLTEKGLALYNALIAQGKGKDTVS